MSGDDRFSCYRIEDILGKGGTANVYRVRDVNTGRDWAMKVFNAETDPAQKKAVLYSMEAEEKSLLRLRHRAVPAVREIFYAEGRKVIVMDYVKGETLAHLIGKRHFTVCEILSICIQLADILSYLQRQKPPVFHTDLKPSNMILKKDGALFLIDFGAASGEGRAAAAIGTRKYAAPELLSGHGLPGPRTEIWSFGMILKELLETAESAPRVLYEVMRKCLCRDPAGRFRSAAELERVLFDVQGKIRPKRK